MLSFEIPEVEQDIQDEALEGLRRKLGVVARRFSRSDVEVKYPADASASDEEGWEDFLSRLISMQDYECERFLRTCCFSHDTPGWILWSAAPSNARLLVIGGGWGRQLELLTQYYSSITVIEALKIRRRVLKERLELAKASAFRIYSPDEYDAASSDGRSAVDTILVRGNFSESLSFSRVTEWLRKSTSGGDAQTELFVETWGQLESWIRSLNARKQRHGAMVASASRWRRWLSGDLDMKVEACRVEGAHWYGGAYLPNEAAHRRDRIRSEKATDGLRKTAWSVKAAASRHFPEWMPAPYILAARSKSDDRRHRLARILEGCRGRNSVSTTTGYRVTGRGAAMPLPLDEDPVLRIPLTPRARMRGQNSHDVLYHLHDVLPKEWSRVLPHSKRRKTKTGDIVFSETMLFGRPGTRNLDTSSMEQSLRWLANLHGATVQVVTDESSQSAKVIRQRVAKLQLLSQTIIDENGDDEHRRAWKIVETALLHPPWEAGVALCATHGDFNPTNLLFDDGELCGVIDWETAQLEGLPVRDVFWMILYPQIEDQRHTASAYESLFLGASLPSLLEGYCQQAPAEVVRFIRHPWSRVVYPLERLQSVWDGYDLRGIIDPRGFAGDWLEMVSRLARYVEYSKPTLAFS